jgi:hypothetical protein
MGRKKKPDPGQKPDPGPAGGAYARYIKTAATPPAPPVGVCRVCGCTDDDCSACVVLTGSPCYWITPDLCSACADGETERLARAALDILALRYGRHQAFHILEHIAGEWSKLVPPSRGRAAMYDRAQRLKRRGGKAS